MPSAGELEQLEHFSLIDRLRARDTLHIGEPFQPFQLGETPPQGADGLTVPRPRAISMAGSHATEIKVRAERRCGELLARTAETGERASRGKPAETSHASTLSDMGLTRDESSRYQQLAAMPDDHFESADLAAERAAYGFSIPARVAMEMLSQSHGSRHLVGMRRPGRHQ